MFEAAQKWENNAGKVQIVIPKERLNEYNNLGTYI